MQSRRERREQIRQIRNHRSDIKQQNPILTFRTRYPRVMYLYIILKRENIGRALSDCPCFISEWRPWADKTEARWAGAAANKAKVTHSYALSILALDCPSLFSCDETFSALRPLYTIHICYYCMSLFKRGRHGSEGLIFSSLGFFLHLMFFKAIAMQWVWSAVCGAAGGRRRAGVYRFAGSAVATPPDKSSASAPALHHNVSLKHYGKIH